MDDKMNDVINEVQKKLGEEYEVKRIEVMKNNDTKLKGIQIRRKDMNVAKICYWTSESVDEIVAVINRSLFPKFAHFLLPETFAALTLTPCGEVSASENAASEAQAFCDLPATGASVIAVDTDTMGRGDEKLGHILMKGLIYALAHGESVPKKMIFFNGGAPLTCEGSESLEDIKELESRGTQILTCGTCLDFYGIREKLAVGGVTNLYEIAKVMAGEPGVTTL